MGMLNTRRRDMGGRRDCPYQKIEYLESEGVQYIDTLLEPNQEMSIELECLITKDLPIYAFQNPTGVREDTGNNSRDQISFSVRGTDTGSYNYYGWGAWQYNYGKTFNLNTRLKCYIDKTNLIINNVTAINTGKKEVISTGRTIYLFGRNIQGIQNCIYGRIYYAIYKINGEPVLDLIPVRIGDEGYMYDRVSGRLFGNQGEGKFLLGPDVK